MPVVPGINTTADYNLEEAILMCLCYFDVFHYPLKPEQIRDFVPYILSDGAKMEHLLGSGPLGKLVSSRDGYFFLDGKDPGIVAQRHQQEQFAKKRWRIARFMAGIIKMFPYVRAVFVSGNLSKNLSRKDSDIDFFILTSPGKLWIAKFLLTAFKKVFLLNRRTYFCINYFRSTDYLKFEISQNFFTAVELLTLVPVYNRSYYGKILRENDWINPIFPNHRKIGFVSGRYTETTNGFTDADNSLKAKGFATADNSEKTSGFGSGSRTGNHTESGSGSSTRSRNGFTAAGSSLKTNGFTTADNSEKTSGSGSDSNTGISNGCAQGRFSERRSIVQIILEGILLAFDIRKWDAYFMKYMQDYWSRKYPETGDGNRNGTIHPTKSTSKPPTREPKPSSYEPEQSSREPGPSSRKPHKYRISEHESAALGEDSEQAVMNQFMSRFDHYREKLRQLS